MHHIQCVEILFGSFKLQFLLHRFSSVHITIGRVISNATENAERAWVFGMRASATLRTGMVIPVHSQHSNCHFISMAICIDGPFAMAVLCVASFMRDCVCMACTRSLICVEYICAFRYICSRQFTFISYFQPYDSIQLYSINIQHTFNERTHFSFNCSAKNVRLWCSNITKIGNAMNLTEWSATKYIIWNEI